MFVHLLNCSTPCFQTLYVGVSLLDWVSCIAFGLLSSKSTSQGSSAQKWLIVPSVSLNCWSCSPQIWYADVSLPDKLACEEWIVINKVKVTGFKGSKNVRPPHVFWPAEHFAAKVGMSLVDRTSCQKFGLLSQWFRSSKKCCLVYSELLNSLQPNVVYWFRYQ